MMEKKQSLRWPLIVLGATLGIPLVAVIAVALWYAIHYSRPLPKPPTPKMPSPNAFDVYVAAGKKLMLTEEIGYAVSDAPHPDPNTSRPSKADRAYSLAEKENMLRANSAALKELRSGFRHIYLNPPVRSIDQEFPQLKTFKNLARVLQLEAQVRAAHGDWEGAIESCLDGLRLGSDVPRGGPTIHKLVGVTIEGIGRKELWTAVDHLDAQCSKSTAERIVELSAHEVPFSDALLEEKWVFQASMDQMLSQTTQDPTAPDEMRQFPPFVRKLIGRRYAERMDDFIAEARKPYAARPLQHEQPTSARNPIARIPNALTDVMLPIFDKAYCADTKRRAQNNLLAATLALRAYKLENGRYPDRLEQLAPGYLKTVPSDPFALKGPLRYKQDGSKYVLYSVGPDGKDDEGRAIDSPKKHGVLRDVSTPERRHHVDANSKGDIVAGVNIN